MGIPVSAFIVYKFIHSKKMKHKADVVIFGNLIGERRIEGGGFFAYPKMER